MKLKLDAKTVAGLELAGRDEEIVWDHDLPGFGLRLRRNGGDTRRTFVVQYPNDGRRRPAPRVGAVHVGDLRGVARRWCTPGRRINPPRRLCGARSPAHRRRTHRCMARLRRG